MSDILIYGAIGITISVALFIISCIGSASYERYLFVRELRSRGVDKYIAIDAYKLFHVLINALRVEQKLSVKGAVTGMLVEYDVSNIDWKSVLTDFYIQKPNGEVVQSLRSKKLLERAIMYFGSFYKDIQCKMYDLMCALAYSYNQGKCSDDEMEKIIYDNPCIAGILYTINKEVFLSDEEDAELKAMDIGLDSRIDNAA